MRRISQNTTQYCKYCGEEVTKIGNYYYDSLNLVSCGRKGLLHLPDSKEEKVLKIIREHETFSRSLTLMVV